MPPTPYEMQEEDAKRIGQRVRWARELVSGETATTLAAFLGVDTSSLRHIERGARLPSIRMLMTLCHALRISPQYLLWGSLEGVDPELAGRLKSAHPELSWPSTPPAPGNTHNSLRGSIPRPKTRSRNYGAAAR